VVERRAIFGRKAVERDPPRHQERGRRLLVAHLADAELEGNRALLGVGAEDLHLQAEPFQRSALGGEVVTVRVAAEPRHPLDVPGQVVEAFPRCLRLSASLLDRS
jgi:hypothetical protein